MPSLLNITDRSDTSEYCLLDTFKAECSREEIIFITHARYGAMKIGRCIETEIGKLFRIFLLEYNITMLFINLTI